MTPEIESRLHDHVGRVLAAAGVPERMRSDLSEELLGHLVERWNTFVSEGMDESAAADRAVADFGSATHIGRQFATTYHSAVWASTIGVLLPNVATPASRPHAVRWLRGMLALLIALDGLAFLVVPRLSPLHLLTTTAALILSLTGLVAAFVAIGRGQRWALRYAVWATAIVLVIGLVEALRSRGDTLTIPVGSILAGLALLVAYRQREQLSRFVAGSARVGRALGFALVLSVLSPLTPWVLAAVPDPTQASAVDLDLAIEMECTREDVPSLTPVIRDAQVVTLVVDATWSHTDLLPSGLTGLITGADDGDTLGVRVVGSETPWVWGLIDNQPSIVDLASGEHVGWSGSTSPSVALLPDDVMGSLTAAISADDLHPGRTLRSTWRFVWEGSREEPWPRIDVYYAHRDRFLLAGRVDCNGITHGVPVDPASVQPAGGGLPPLP